MYNNFSYFLININDKYEAEILLKQLALFVKISPIKIITQTNYGKINKIQSGVSQNNSVFTFI
jgi:hypothetical protein